MKKIIVVILLSQIINLGFPQTIISGGTVNGTWTEGNSPYQITGSIMIENGETLVIEPGVTIEFQGHYKLLVLGTLISEGTANDSIFYTASNTIDGWKGIRFDNTANTNDSSKIRFSSIQYTKPTGSGDDIKGGGIFFKNFSKAIISNNKISNHTVNFGGGIYCEYSAPIIRENTISYNTTLTGGGIYLDHSSPTIYNNAIEYNSASYMSYGGAGIFCSYSNPTIMGNTIRHNYADDCGGGIQCYYSSPDITNNEITNNNVGVWGGGIYCVDNSAPQISSNIISNNSSQYGAGGIYCSQSFVEISYNIISNNQANSGPGGGLYVTGNNNDIGIRQNHISNNSAERGAALYLEQSDLKMVNNIISNNSSSIEGGALYLHISNPDLYNNTICNNYAVSGGAIYCNSNSNPIFINNIIWGNSASSGSQVYLYDENSDPTFQYSNIEGGQANFEINGNFYLGDYQNNIDSDPLFISVSAGAGINYDALSANWNLQANSPCIDTGIPNASSLTIGSFDYAGNPRITGNNIDIGAYEVVSVGIKVPQEQQSISIYPNPSNGIIHVDCKDIQDIKVYNASGSMIKTSSESTIDLSQYSNGIYTINIVSKAGIFNRKIVLR